VATSEEIRTFADENGKENVIDTYSVNKTGADGTSVITIECLVEHMKAFRTY
jgi:hypothetical protein